MIKNPWSIPTNWSMIEDAIQPTDGSRRDQAWHWLQKRYQRAVLNTVRRRMPGQLDCEETAVEFFAYVWEHSILSRADRKVGPLRCYLQGVLARFLSDRRRSFARHSKHYTSLDGTEPAINPVPPIEQAEEEDWARNVVNNALTELRKRKPRDTEILMCVYGIEPYIATEREALAQSFGMKRDSLDRAVTRARNELGKLIREELRRGCVSSSELEVDENTLINRMLSVSSSLVQY